MDDDTHDIDEYEVQVLRPVPVSVRCCALRAGWILQDTRDGDYYNEDV